MKVLLFLCMSFLSILFSSDRIEKGKNYISLDHLYLSNEGIVVLVGDSEYKLSAVYRDERGYYFLSDSVYGECPCGHPAVTNWGECDVPTCPYCRRDD